MSPKFYPLKNKTLPLIETIIDRETMKRLLLPLLLLAALSINMQAQTKVDHIIKVNAGVNLFAGTEDYDGDGGFAVGVSYAADVWVNDKWSVMPEIGLRTQADLDISSGINMVCAARYHFQPSGGPIIVVGLGPELMFLTNRGSYYYDANPNYGLNHKTKFKSCSIALHPSIVLESGKHWLWGLDISLGLNDMRKKYPEYNINGTTRFEYLMLTCGYRF